MVWIGFTVKIDHELFRIFAVNHMIQKYMQQIPYYSNCMTILKLLLVHVISKQY